MFIFLHMYNYLCTAETIYNILLNIGVYYFHSKSLAVERKCLFIYFRLKAEFNKTDSMRINYNCQVD